jgi:hypothetical protein
MPWPLHRLEPLAVLGFGAAGNAQHRRLRRPVNIGVEHADAHALGRKRQREIHGSGAFADAALARGDRNDVLDARHQLYAALHRVRDDFHRDVGGDAADARYRFQFGDDLLADRLDLGLGRVTEQNVERHVVAVDLDVLCFLAGDVVLAGVRVGQLFECRLDLLFGDRHGSVPKSP